MILIADSGSTKTTWMEVETGNMIVTEGLNPHFTTEGRFLDACAVVRQNFQLPTFNFPLFFYGAGCGLATQRQKVAAWLAKAFGSSDVHVDTDMLAACRATAGDQPALAAILGTGSNACYYNGSTIECQPTSTGYILGDHGSANHVGRILLNDYLTHRMPEDLRDMFRDTYRMSDTELMDAVYHQPNPNRFLASLAPFAVSHAEDEYCDNVLAEALHEWYHGPLQTLRRQSGYNEGEINFVGGFAKAIEDKLHACFAGDTLTVGTVMADPIEGLRRYHLGASMPR